jgi:methyltransferase (TIGR00027 family)
MGRALADARGKVPRFSDPFAIQLLPAEHRKVVERLLAGEWPRTWGEAPLAVIASVTEKLLGPRTVEIDDGLREMPPGYQLVILGAGLDARAYRMRELSGSIVFEVDHPASQALKRERAEGLSPSCRELRYVPVDFSRDALSDALSRAGHSATVPTAWVFEGVITYLTPAEVEASIAAMAARSAPGSRLLATYNEQNWARSIFGSAAWGAGEPQRASFRPGAMWRLLERYGFSVLSDRDGFQRAERLGIKSLTVDRFLRFHHVVIVVREPT